MVLLHIYNHDYSGSDMQLTVYKVSEGPYSSKKLPHLEPETSLIVSSWMNASDVTCPLYRIGCILGMREYKRLKAKQLLKKS